MMLEGYTLIRYEGLMTDTMIIVPIKIYFLLIIHLDRWI
jgi:hypothetical protein